MDTSTAVDKTN